jgi:hypothetical protein
MRIFLYHAALRTSADRVSPKLEHDRDLLPGRGRLRRGLPLAERYVPRRAGSRTWTGQAADHWDRDGFKPTIGLRSRRSRISQVGSRVSDAQGPLDPW